MTSSVFLKCIFKDIDDKGYFKGQLDFGTSQTTVNNVGHPMVKPLIGGIHFFFGEMEFTLHRNKSRHPFRPKENRRYRGRLYVVSRLDFAYDNYKIEDYLKAEYEILHYQEMETIEFRLVKFYTSENLPKEFTLHKKSGADFDPYAIIKELIFSGNTFCDK